MTERIISVEHLSKRYGKQLALKDVSFEIQKGQVWGVVGPNGSGKTTLFSILLGLRKPNSGSFAIFGQANPEDVRDKVGVILDQGNFYAGISAKKNLTISAMTKNVPLSKVDELLDKVGLGEVGKKPFKSFSYGMKKRLEIADALLSDPELVIMDEPTNGLDPEGVIFIRELIMELKRQGKTIVLSSHYLEEIQKVCTHFLILKKGELVFHGSQEAVLGKFDSLESALTNKL